MVQRRVLPRPAASSVRGLRLPPGPPTPPPDSQPLDLSRLHGFAFFRAWRAGLTWSVAFIDRLPSVGFLGVFAWCDSSRIFRVTDTLSSGRAVLIYLFISLWKDILVASKLGNYEGCCSRHPRAGFCVDVHGQRLWGHSEHNCRTAREEWA